MLEIVTIGLGLVVVLATWSVVLFNLASPVKLERKKSAALIAAPLAAFGLMLAIVGVNFYGATQDAHAEQAALDAFVEQYQGTEEDISVLGYGFYNVWVYEFENGQERHLAVNIPLGPERGAWIETAMTQVTP